MSWSDRSTTTLPPPSIRVATIGATTRRWKAGSPMTRASPAAIPAVRGAWRWPRKRPIFAVTTADGDVLLVNTLETSQATLELGGQKVTVEQKSGFPRHGHVDHCDPTARRGRLCRQGPLAGLGGACGSSRWPASKQKADCGRLDRLAVAGSGKAATRSQSISISDPG